MESKDVMPSLSKRRSSALRLANFRRTISSSIGLCLILCIFSGCSTLHPHTGSDIPPSTQEAMKALYIGMTETEALLVMKPVAMDVARITYGDTGRGQLYFQISPTKQFWVQLGPGPESIIEQLGKAEPKRKWTRDSRHNVSFE